MPYQRFKLPEIETFSATLATTATVPTEISKTVANVANVAKAEAESAIQNVATVATVASCPAHSGAKDRWRDRPSDWMPEPGPGITILRPAIEVSAAEYDAHLNTMIVALPAGSAEAQRMTFAKRKGWVVDRDGERIFTRGRT